jgi:hypothetical protein
LCHGHSYTVTSSFTGKTNRLETSFVSSKIYFVLLKFLFFIFTGNKNFFIILSYGPDANRHRLRFGMNGAIKALERETIARAGPSADRFLDDIGNLVGSTEGISSKRDVS